MTMSIEMGPARQVIVRGRPARVFVGGSGVTLLLLHGGFGGAELHWSRVWGALCRNHHVIAPELPGLGQLDQPALGSVRDYAAWLVELLDVLGCERAWCIGNSFGASVAWSLAAHSPARCAGLVMVNGIPMPRTPPGLAWVGRTGAGKALLRGLLRRFVYTPSALSRAFANERLVPSSLARTMVDDWPQIVPRYVGLLIAGEGSPPPPVPTALLWGAGDRLAGSTRTAAQNLHRALPGSTLHLIEGVGHFPQLEAPERFVAALLSLVEGHSRPARSSVSNSYTPKG